MKITCRDWKRGRESRQEDKRKGSEKEVTEVASTSRVMKIKMRIRKTGRAERRRERRSGVTRMPSPSFSLCQAIFLSLFSPPSSAVKEKLQSVCWSCRLCLMLTLLKHYIN